METITSRHNPLVAHLRRLASSGSYRRERGEFLCDSPKLLHEALLHGAELLTVAATRGMTLPDGIHAGVRLVEASSMKALGQACGVEVKTASAGIRK